MKLATLLAELPQSRIQGPIDGEIGSLCMDSRKAQSGSLFFALSGTATDGNRHVKDAIENGAGAIISEMAPPPAPFSLSRWSSPERPVTWVQTDDALAAMSRLSAVFYGRPSSDLRVVGVTGTNGKTTVTYLLESIFTKVGAPAGVLGTVNYRLRGRTLEAAANTTPLSMDLQRLLSRMKGEGASHVAMEVSSHALALKRVEDVEFDVAIFMNLHQDHLDYHKTPEKYFEAKARLFELLCRTDSRKKNKLGVVNIDDGHGVRMKRRLVDADCLTFGLSEGADVAGTGIVPMMDGTLFRMKYQNREWAVRLKLIGEHNVYNALAAAAACLWLGHPMEKVLSGLESLACVPGRLEPVKAGQDFAVYVDFAHTEAALYNVLSSVRKLSPKRLVTVFGCGGDRDKTKRGPMGAIASELSDHVLLTSDNPRSEDPLRILSEIEAGIKTQGRQNYRMVPDRAEAISEAVKAAQAGDAVVIAGKGHETTQTFRDRTVHFDDRESASEAIKRRLAS